jgi:hypothetical protein
MMICARTFVVLVIIAMACIVQDASANAPSLTAEPRVMKKNHDPVTVTWSNIPSPDETDHIGVYMPPDSPYPIELLSVTHCGCDWKSGNGRLRFGLMNMRDSYVFKYLKDIKSIEHFSDSLKREIGKHDPPIPIPKSVVDSNTVSFANPNEPTEAHLQLGSEPYSMEVRWTMRDVLSDAVVHYGTNPTGTLPNTVSAKSYKLNVTMLPGLPAKSQYAWRDAGEFYHAVMTNLQPGQKYYYQFGSSQHGLSTLFSFIAPPKADAHTPVKFVFFGDMGTCCMLPYPAGGSITTANKIVSDIQQWGAQLTILGGDMSYARGFSYLWSQFQNQMQPIATRVPMQVSFGNHETLTPGSNWEPSFYHYGNDGGGEGGMVAAARFGFAPFASRQQWYSFDYGSVHFVIASGERNFLHGSPQYAFIEKDLEHIDRSKTPWVIFVSHRPFYSAGASDPHHGLTGHMREAFEPLLLKHKVDLVLHGHIHLYRRTCPLANGKCVGAGKGPVYATVGNGGHHVPASKHIADTFIKQIGERFGRSRIQVFNSSALLFQSVASDNDEILDEFWIHR